MGQRGRGQRGKKGRASAQAPVSGRSSASGGGPTAEPHTAATEPSGSEPTAPAAAPNPLRDELLALCQRSGWSARFLGRPPGPGVALEDSCLKEIVACRGAGRAELALALADAAIASGLSHPRILANRERARRAQKRGSSLTVWDPSGLGAEGGRRSRWRLRLLGWLPGRSGERSSGSQAQVRALLDVCAAAGWSPHYLDTVGPHDLGLACVREMRSCRYAGQHDLVVALAERAASLGLQHEGIQRNLERSWKQNRAEEAASAAADGLTTLLETAIQLRHEGQAEASLALLNAALNRGETSPWIHDNRARALVNQGQRWQAMLIWEALAREPDPTLAAMATERLDDLRREVLLPIDTAIRDHAAKSGWSIRAIGDPLTTPLPDVLNSLLQEAIQTREHRQRMLSISILDQMLQVGMDSIWIHDNRARVLVDMGREIEAVELWEGIVRCDDAVARQMAQEMLDLYGPRVWSDRDLARADQLVANGERDQAITWLCDCLLRNPGSPRLQQRLQALIDQRDGRSGPAETAAPGSPRDELGPKIAAMKAFDAILTRLEQQVGQADPAP
ncbi:MAG: hypothetical protein ACKOPN_07935 [Prochlorococcaceae cyanobacterium]